MCFHKIIEVWASDLLFPLDNHLQIHRERAAILHVCFNCLEMDKNLTFIVGRAASIEIVPADCCLKRRGRPKIQGVNGLDVVMTIEQHGRLTGSSHPFAVDNRMAFRFEDLNVLHSDGAHMIRDPLRTSPHVGIMILLRAHAWDCDEILELGEVPILV